MFTVNIKRELNVKVNAFYFLFNVNLMVMVIIRIIMV